jgi:hypothetical protein
VSPIAEMLASFRGTGPLTSRMLVRGGVPLALAQLSLRDGVRIVDLDDPAVLLDVSLCPSQVATARRIVTQADAARLFSLSAAPAALRWWSTIEASYANLTVFDRARHDMDLVDVTPLGPTDASVREAAELLGLIG